MTQRPRTGTLPRLGTLILALFITSVPGFASLLYTCDPTIGTTTCAAINGSSVSGIYSSIFTSSMSADIYITYGNTGVGQSSTPLTAISYSTYYNALAAHTDDPTALASLGSSGDPLGAQSDNTVSITPALANALSIHTSGANTAGIQADGATSCVLGNSGCYDGVITISNTAGAFYFPDSPTSPPPSAPPYQIDFYSVVEHETDEVLGTISCIGTRSSAAYDQCSPLGTNASPADLFRYSAAGVRSFLNAANGTSAYFSINGGVTDIADYNNSPNGQDYGDWLNLYPYLVQDGEASPDVTLDISTDVGTNGNAYPRPEVAVLNAIGYNQIVAPEPGTFGLLAAGFVSFAVFGKRLRGKL